MLYEYYVVISTAKIANFEQITTCRYSWLGNFGCHFYRKDSEF